MHSPIICGTMKKENFEKANFKSILNNEDYILGEIRGADYMSVVEDERSRWELEEIGLPGTLDVKEAYSILTITRVDLKERQEIYIISLKQYVDFMEEVQKEDTFGLGRYPNIAYKKGNSRLLAIESVGDNFYNGGGGVRIVLDEFVITTSELLADAGNFYNANQDSNDGFKIYLSNDFQGDYHF